MKDFDENMERVHGGFFENQKIEYDFSVSVNPLGLPEAAKKAIMEAVDYAGCYPDPEGKQVKVAFANYLKRQTKINIDDTSILLGNGAAELIYSLCQCVFHQDNHQDNQNELFVNKKCGVILGPTFSEYAYAINEAGGVPVFVNSSEENQFSFLDSDYENVLTEIEKGVEIVFICNPNNPTGKLHKKDMLLKILNLCEKTKTILCVDECFMPFCNNWKEETLLTEIKNYKCLCVLRAMTKYYSMAGLRMGLLISGNDSLLYQLKKKIQPWNTSIFAQKASVQALLDDDYIEKTKEWLLKEKAFLLESFQELEIKVFPEAAANFLFFEGPKNLQELLFAKGIAIRCFSDIPMKHTKDTVYFRIGIRTHDENENFVHIMKEIFSQEEMVE